LKANSLGHKKEKKGTKSRRKSLPGESEKLFIARKGDEGWRGVEVIRGGSGREGGG